MDTLLFASLMGLYYWFARLRLGYTFSAMLLQPVVVAVFVGLLLGNMPAAMIIGAGMQLVYLGVTSTPGGNVPSDPALLGLVLRFPVVFAANYFGQNVVESFLKLMPHWLTHSFEIMGGILPALGFAITIMVIGKKSLLPWFIGGFFAVLYLKVDIMAMAIFGTCVAFLIKGLAKNEGAA
ncbi:PTS sugar transporter subunit IIC [Escherichia coli]|nr:PTS sugar transporter subunit IIC [Escherichia coli]